LLEGKSKRRKRRRSGWGEAMDIVR